MAGVVFIRPEQVGKEIADTVHEANVMVASGRGRAGRAASRSGKVSAVSPDLHIVGGESACDQLLSCPFGMIMSIEYAYDCLVHVCSP
jgi:hypothetical protein